MFKYILAIAGTAAMIYSGFYLFFVGRLVLGLGGLNLVDFRKVSSECAFIFLISLLVVVVIYLIWATIFRYWPFGNLAKNLAALDK